MEAQLRRLGPNSKIKLLRVPKECRTKIWLGGRGTSCQIYTKSKFASRQHFCITYKENKYFISDLQSANGTFVNDEKLVSEQPLAPGNVISVGVPSEMQNSQDCIVYVFESCSNLKPPEKPVNTSDNNQTVDNKRKCPSDTPPRVENGNCLAVNSPKPSEVEVIRDSPDEEKTILADNDVILIDSPVAVECEPKPAKIRKVEPDSPIAVTESEQGKPKTVTTEQNVTPQQLEVEDDDDIMAYEALTQVDEPLVKKEPELLNYSLTEELIEISDSEDDWSSGLKPEGDRSPEDGEEDEEVVFLEKIVKSKEATKFDAPPVVCKVEDDLTEVDKKWFGKLLKIKTEDEFFRGSQEVKGSEDEQPVGEMEGERGEESHDKEDETIAPCAAQLSLLSTNDADPPTAFPVVEVPKTIVRRAVPKKSVSFNMVPHIKYFEVTSRPKLTASEKGKLRFTRIIFNICNWNSHWLEECKRVAPGKDPPDLCEERLRKIPKKFPSHSDYMGAFIPAMLLQLWNKIRDKWVSSGESGFRQTVSCDSCEDYHTENLFVYKCTGLVQNVDAHKDLVREGHLVLLRLHQCQNAQLMNPASEKYSKKLGYLVFGFVEGRMYERYNKQPLHQALAERCASIVGDLHVVRLTILVKKRPSFQLDKRKLVQLTVVHRITQELRIFRGICFLPDSPLCAAILKPLKTEFTLPEPPKKEEIVFKGSLDDVQSEIVRKLSFACSSTNSFLYSIHGAAGTGKGQVIAALLMQFLHGDEWKNQRPKVLYCTQWSIPLDEMLARLRACAMSFDKPLNLVRVGPLREVKPEVRDLCLSNLAAGLRASDQRLHGRKFDAEIELLKDADVIFTTCLTSATASMCSAFEKVLIKDKNRKVICIIDEAMSSTEKDSIIPLLLGVTHLILVGDIYQMEPTFSGEKTHSLGLDMPLFWRIYKNFSSLPKETWPICILKTQYRTNPSLSKFTSTLIYSTPLLKPSVSLSNRIANIRTHLMLVDLTTEDGPNGEKETADTRIVCQTTRAVVKAVKASCKNGIRFAVVTCDAKQVENVQVSLPKREFPEVEIGQLQAFQGRQFDVVVFMYDGRQMPTSWLATALTRARSSLFVVTSQQCIGKNSFFRKIAVSAEKYNFLKYVHPDMKLEEFEQIITV